jgi:ribosomal protein L29
MKPRSAGNQALATLRGHIAELEAELAAERSRSASQQAEFEREREQLVTERGELRATLAALRAMNGGAPSGAALATRILAVRRTPVLVPISAFRPRRRRNSRCRAPPPAPGPVAHGHCG